MDELKIPTAGRVVHYFPNGADAHTAKNGAELLPATVVQPFGTAINLAVTCMNPDGPVVLRYSVQHKSLIAKNEDDSPKAGQSYWDCPEIK